MRGRVSGQARYLAVTIFAQWLIQQLHGSYVYPCSSGKGRPAPGGGLNGACQALVEHASKEDPSKLFGAQSPSLLHSLFRLGKQDTPKERIAEELARLVRDAAQIISDAFTVFIEENNQDASDSSAPMTWNRAHFDAEKYYFTYLPVDEERIEWTDAVPPRKVPGAIEVNLVPASDEWLETFGIHPDER